jgi:polysaccharide pyruvyl transferase WcaK-like protein
MLALVVGSPLVLLPQTVGPFETRLGRFIARIILRGARRTYVRDLESAKEVNRLLGSGSKSPELACDLGFALEPLAPDGTTKDEVLALRSCGNPVGLNISGLLYAGGYNGANQFSLRVDYRRLIHEIIQLFVGELRVPVMLIPHVLGGSEDPESDVMACKQIYQAAAPDLKSGLHLLGGKLNHHETKWVIGQCDFFVGSRMHACIAALSQGIPAVGLAYSRKFAGVFRVAGVESLVIDLTRNDIERTLASLRDLFRNREALSSRIRVRAPQLKESALTLLKGLELE